jgi:DNA-binding winged helix-turn-helix (wHTH) protein/Tfp pilus assembly protein PilF
MLDDAKYMLGPFLVDCQRRKICRADVELNVHWRSFLALQELLEAHGEVVDKNRLVDLLWSGATVEESNLHKYISHLRRALNEADPTQEYITTVPRLGYRLAIPAEKLPDLPEKPPPTSPRRIRAGPRVIAALAIVAAAAIVGAITWDVRPAWNQSSRCEQAYTTGMDLLRRRDLPSVRSATDQLRRAVESCPQSAKAWAGLAEASSFLHPEDTNTCLEFAERSVKLDPGCGECQAILGFVLFARHWRWKEAGEHLQRAITLTPRDPQTRYWSAQWGATQGQLDSALRSVDSSLRTNPQGLNLLVMKSAILYFARDYERAVQVADQALAVNLPSAWQWRSASLFMLDREAEAVRSLAFELSSWTSMSPEATAQRAVRFAERYNQDGLQGVLGDLLRDTAGADVAKIQSFNRAKWFMRLGKSEEALRELEIAVDARVFDIIYLRVNPLFDPVREQPRFREVLRRIGV